MKRKIIFTILFLTVSILHLIGMVTNSIYLQIATKPLIAPLLILVYFYSVEKVNKWYLLALLFSFIGDVLLMDKINNFLLGIGAFLITQLLFIFIIGLQIKTSNWRQKMLASIPFIVYVVVLLMLVKDGLGEFLIPVIIYGIAISIFGVFSLLNYLLNKNSYASKYLFIGALFFISSDSLIALNKFYEANIIYPVVIMLTYIIAQYLILEFMVKLGGSRDN